MGSRCPGLGMPSVAAVKTHESWEGSPSGLGAASAKALVLVGGRVRKQGLNGEHCREKQGPL